MKTIDLRLYDRLAIQKKELYVKFFEKELSRNIKATKNLLDVPWVKGDIVCDSNLIAFYYYYLEKKKDAKNTVISLLDYAKDYFFGKWRYEAPTDQGKIDPERFRKYMNWIDYFRYIIFWGSCIDQWAQITEIAQYPCDYTEGEIWEPKEYRSWYLLIAAILRGEPLEQLSKYTIVIENGKKKREKLLLKLLNAILDNDVDRADQELKSYLKYYKQYEFPKPEIREKLTIDGTFLINFARHKGIELEYPQEYSDHIVRLN